jgi:hypothetical protein
VAVRVTRHRGHFARCRHSHLTRSPLGVVGFTLEAGKPDQALGAFLLFLTNVATILGSGTVVMALYGFFRPAAPSAGPERPAVNCRNAVIIIAAIVRAVSIPLSATSVILARRLDFGLLFVPLAQPARASLLFTLT